MNPMNANKKTMNVQDDFESLEEYDIKQSTEQSFQSKTKEQIEKNDSLNRPYIIRDINDQLKYNYNDLKTEDTYSLNQLLSAGVIQSSLGNGEKLYTHKTRNIFTHQLVQMVHLAYEFHYPLSLSPDNIQLLISQGFAAHIQMNAEKFRKKFVQHEGQKELQVEVKQVSNGKWNYFNIYDVQWPQYIAQICSQIKDNIGEEKYNLCVHQYSTTDETTQLCYAACLMDAMQKYFSYSMICACGISKVKLLGTLEDWIKIRENLEKLREFELDWWIDKLAPVLDQFINLYKGQVDKKFWGSIYKYQESQGIYEPSFATGWITYFFPYRVDEHSRRSSTQFMKNDFSNKEEKYIKLIAKQIPTGISMAPVKVKDQNGSLLKNVNFNAGFFGVGMDDQGFLNVKHGWAVTHLIEKGGEMDKPFRHPFSDY